MDYGRIFSLANNLRKKIDRAQRRGLLENTMLKNFPVQYCGVASTLLAEFLRDNGVETLYISNEKLEIHEPHAWLIVKDDSIGPPRFCYDGVPNNIMDILGVYSGSNPEGFEKATCYDEQEIKKGLIVDITGDQFSEDSVCVGYMDDFHRRFSYISAFEHEGLVNNEHIELYDIIVN